MVKRRNSEVLLTGEKVDPRYKTSTPLSDDDPMKAATRVMLGGDSAAQRIRKRPDVIDGTGKPAAPVSARTSLKNADLSSLEDDLGLTPTGRSGEGKAWEEIERKKKAEPDHDWEENRRAKKPEADTDWEENKRAKKPETDPNWEENKQSRNSAPDESWADAAPKPAPVAAPLVAPAPALKPASTGKDKKSKPASPKELSREKAASAVTSMVEQMKAKAAGNGGFLRTEDITAMEKGFQDQVSELTQSLEISFEAYVEARERAEWDSAREFPFGRVVVKRFSHLFKEPRDGRMDTVSKRMLPGFFSGLNMMIGPESVDLFQERCRRVVEKIRDQDGEDFDWDSVYAAPETSAVVIDALMTIAPHFDNFQRRQDWFIELINGHLAPVGEHEPDAGWEMSPVGYKRFIGALYAELNGMLANDTAHDRISKRYGSNAVEAVIKLVKQAQIKH